MRKITLEYLQVTIDMDMDELRNSQLRREFFAAPQPRPAIDTTGVALLETRRG